MKTKKLYSSVLLTVAFFMATSGLNIFKIAPTTNTTPTTEAYGNKAALADKDLTVTEMITYAIQDEYLAHGEYVAITETFNVSRPYSNILKSEETHLSLLKKLTETYNISFPKDDSASHLVVPNSLLEAAKTGVQAEIDNIAMYDLFLSYELPVDVRKTFIALKKASLNHLKAFEKQVDRLS